MCMLSCVHDGMPYGFQRVLGASNNYSLRCAAGIAAKQAYTDRDIITFLTNVECLEGQFDTWGTFGRGFINGLEMGGPTPIGAQKANLTEATLRYLQEVALNEQVLLPACAHQLGGHC